MHKNVALATGFAFLLATFIAPTHVLAAAPFELQQAIQEKTKALQAVTSQLQEASKNLGDTESRSQTLKQELNRLGYSIKQTDLGIKSSELTIEKLELEIASLQYDIADAQAKTTFKKSAIEDLLRILQERDKESLLLSLLKNKTIGELALEAQSLSSFNANLSGEVVELKNTQAKLVDTLKSRADKRSAVQHENQALKIKKGSLDDQKQERQNLLSQTKNQEKLYQQQISELEKKQSAISSDIESIETELRSKIDPSLLPQKRPGVLAMPTNGILSQNFGATAFARQGGYRGKFHNGIDIAAPIGTPVYAAEDGVVVKSGNQDLYCRKGAYGKYIVISHENNLVTLYGHLSFIGVNDGQAVKRGEFIGYVGKTGYATGPHLHLTVYSKPTFYIGTSRVCGAMPYGGYLNPLDYLQI